MADKDGGLLVGFGPSKESSEKDAPPPESDDTTSPDSAAEDAALSVVLGKGDLATRKTALRDFVDMRIHNMKASK